MTQGTDPTPASPMELAYAPLPKDRSRVLWVIVVGLITTAVTLAGVYALDLKGESHIMGFYADYVFPVGAILVGLAASSGYAFMAWKLGVKVRRGLLVTILGLLLAAYFAAEYVEFVAMGPLGVPTGTKIVNGKEVQVYRSLGFWEYFHLKAVNWTWEKENSSDKESEPLGASGYFFVLLGIIGFAGSGLLIPFAVGKKPYCELCELYLTKRWLGTIPASVAHRKISKKDTEGMAKLQAEHAAEGKQADDYIKNLSARITAGDVEGFLAVLPEKASSKAASKLPRRVRMDMYYCSNCSSAYVVLMQLNGQGKQTRHTRIGNIQATTDFVRGVRAAWGKPAPE
jgi:hypothetical protein